MHSRSHDNYMGALSKREDFLETTVAATSTSEDSMKVLRQEMMNGFTCIIVSIKNFSRKAEYLTVENLDHNVEC